MVAIARNKTSSNAGRNSGSGCGPTRILVFLLAAAVGVCLIVMGSTVMTSIGGNNGNGNHVMSSSNFRADSTGTSTRNGNGGQKAAKSSSKPPKGSSATTRMTQASTASSNGSDHGVHTKTWPDWPSVAYEEVGHDLVFKGTNFVSRMSDILAGPASANSGFDSMWQEFFHIYQHRPDKINLCGIRINHALALFVSVRHLQPTLVVESGVNAGQSTYFIRAASATTQIYAIDTLDKPICQQGVRWMDTATDEGDGSTLLTTYFTGPKAFKDLIDFDWKKMAHDKVIDPLKTLVFIDDHLNLLLRLPPLFEAGIRHVVVEDNYKLGEGATSGDKNGTPKQLFSAPPHHRLRADGEWLFGNLISYAEFPPLVPPIMAKLNPVERKKAGGFMVAADTNTDIVAPLWRPDLNIQVDGSQSLKQQYEALAAQLEHDPLLKDNQSYMQFMNYNQIVYMELLPMAPSVVGKFTSS